MASVRPRTTAAGKVHYAVTYRHHGTQTSRTFTVKRDAEKVCNLINALGPDQALPRILGTTATGPMPTVAEWVQRHIADLTGVTDRSRADYRSLVRRHIAPTLGPLDVDEVTTADIARWANQLEQSGLSAKSIANLRGLLSAAFAYAVDEGLRSDSPTRRLRSTRSREHERADMVCLTPQEFGHLRSLLPEHWRPFATFLVGTGLRFGEAVALEVRDVDLLAETPIVRVTKSWRRTPGGFEIGPPKSRRSRRTVSLSRDLVDVLAPLVTRLGTELLFTGPKGARVSHSNFWNRVWSPAVKQFEAETGKRPRVHDLRHTHASLLIAKGQHLEAIRDRLGHESIATTQIYSHLLPDQLRRTAEALDGLFSEPDDLVRPIG